MERTLPDTPTDPDGALSFENTPGSAHAISRISERDFEEDFGAEALGSLLHSSAAEPSPNILRPALNDDLGTVDITTVLVDTSQVDARGYKISKYVPCPRSLAQQPSASTSGQN